MGEERSRSMARKHNVGQNDTVRVGGYIVGRTLSPLDKARRDIFLGLAFPPLADLHLDPWACVGGPHEGIRSVVFPPLRL
jgi:hypothetical protein